MSINDLNTTKLDEADKIVLIDSNALIHRSFHALPPLTTKDGTLVNAVYGFTSTILKVLADLKPRYIAATFDVSKDTFRRKIYAEYKAQRIAAPQELYDQIPLVKEVCNVLNIPIFAILGYEADDVIGTIVNKLKTNDIPKKLMLNKLRSYIVTGDKDTYQLVDDNTFIYSIIKGLRNVEIIDTFYVREKYGFEPAQIIDFKALAGDPSDNIPGVPGIGEITAKKLIVEYGTIENLYKKLMAYDLQLKTKLRDLLIDNKAQAFLSKELSTIKTDVPLDFDLGCCLVHDYDKAKALKLLQKLEFKSLVARLPEQKNRHQQESLF